MANKLTAKATYGPKSITPTTVVTLDGKGMTVTCKNCSKKYSTYGDAPDDKISACNSCMLLNLPSAFSMRIVKLIKNDEIILNDVHVFIE